MAGVRGCVARVWRGTPRIEGRIPAHAGCWEGRICGSCNLWGEGWHRRHGLAGCECCDGKGDKEGHGAVFPSGLAVGGITWGVHVARRGSRETAYTLLDFNAVAHTHFDFACGRLLCLRWALLHKSSGEQYFF